MCGGERRVMGLSERVAGREAAASIMGLLAGGRRVGVEAGSVVEEGGCGGGAEEVGVTKTWISMWGRRASRSTYFSQHQAEPRTPSQYQPILLHSNSEIICFTYPSLPPLPPGHPPSKPRSPPPQP